MKDVTLHHPIWKHEAKLLILLAKLQVANFIVTYSINTIMTGPRR